MNTVNTGGLFRKSRFARIIMGALAGIVPLLTGCGDSAKDAENAPVPDPSAVTAPETVPGTPAPEATLPEAASPKVTDHAMANIPANIPANVEPMAVATAEPVRFEAPVIVDTPEISPGATVSRLMEALRTGDTVTSEEMLSSEARRNLDRTGMEFGLPAPAGRGMTYEIVSLEMLGRNGAQVECRFGEGSPGATGAPAGTMQSCWWVLRQEPVRGWRVTGAIVPAIPGAEPILFDFENMEETLRKIAAVQRTLEEGISIR